MFGLDVYLSRYREFIIMISDLTYASDCTQAYVLTGNLHQLETYVNIYIYI